MLENIIIIENENDYQCNTLEEVVKKLIDENYYELNENEKKEKLKIKALANCLGTKYEIIDNASKETNIDNKFVLNNEMTYLMSLLLTNKIVLLEKINSNEFTKYIEKNNIKKNYIIVNNFAKEILIKNIN